MHAYYEFFKSYKQGIDPNIVGGKGVPKASNDPIAYGGNGSGWGDLGNGFLGVGQEKYKSFEEEIKRRAAAIQYERLNERLRVEEERRLAAQANPPVDEVNIDEIIATSLSREQE